MSETRPPIRISFRYNKDTGEIVEFIVDDNAPTASEDYHDVVADTIASSLSRRAEIYEAGNEPIGQTQIVDEKPTPEKIREKESQ